MIILLALIAGMVASGFVVACTGEFWIAGLSGFLVYWLVYLPFLPMLKNRGLSSQQRDAFTTLDRKFGSSFKIRREIADLEGLGEVATVPLHLTATFSKRGVSWSVLYSPGFPIKNLAIPWDEIYNFELNEGLVEWRARVCPHFQFKIPYTRSSAFEKYARVRLRA